MTTHTPGPWFARAAIKAHEFIITAESGGYAPLARVKGDKRSTLPAAQANARLMAAAPELINALIWFVEELADDSAIDMAKLINEMEVKATAAINKATKEPTA